MEEMLYHVNENDEVLKKISRNEAHSRGLLHRSGMVFLMNNEDKILLNMRSSEKKIFPSCYDSSVSFHVTYGETYKGSAKRETEEEIKIKAPLKYIGKIIHRDPPEYQIVSVFLCRSDDEPIIDPEEFSGSKFYSINEAEKIVQNEKITPWLRDGWKILSKYLNLKVLTLSYRRLHNKITRFPVVVLYESPEGIVIFNLLNPSKPLIVEESILLDKSYIGVWFVSKKDWHDLGAIYDREKRFKGYYCDICTPIKRTPDGYEVTDFFLDLWVFPDGRCLVLDQDEFDRAVRQGWISQDQMVKVKAELERLVIKVKSKKFPTLTIENLLKLPENTDEIIHILKQITQNM